MVKTLIQMGLASKEQSIIYEFLECVQPYFKKLSEDIRKSQQ